MQFLRKTLSKIDYSLYTTLLVLGLFPTMYSTFRIFLLGDLPSDWGVNIASQLAWLNVIYEIIQEAIILPLFYFIGLSLTNKHELSNKIITGMIFTFCVYSTLAMVIIAGANPLIVFMAQKPELLSATAHYIRLETVANIFITLVKFGFIVFVCVKKEKSLLFLLCIQMMLTMLCDTLFVSQLPFSLNLGVNGIAVSNILVNGLLFGVMLYLLQKEAYLMWQKLDFSWIKQFIHIGSLSGLESLVRNLAFMLMIIKMINMVGEQGSFWVANGFIWGWLLLPVLQLGELVKRDCGESANTAIREKTIPYFVLTSLIVVIWILTMPFWQNFVRVIFNTDDAAKIVHITIVSLIFYIFFAYNNVIDSIFYGIGKTSYMLFQSLMVNSIFYGSMFIAYKAGVFIPTLDGIVIIFGSGILCDSLLTFGIFYWMLKKRNISLCLYSQHG